MRSYRCVYAIIIAAIMIVVSSCFGPIDEWTSERAANRVRKNREKTLKNLSRLLTLQARFRDRMMRDTDANGVGEFCDGLELYETGVAKKAKFKQVEKSTYLEKDGYYYWIITDGTEYRRERYWCAYAWPKTIWETGIDAFFM